jgi:hypothetical protein
MHPATLQTQNRQKTQLKREASALQLEIQVNIRGAELKVIGDQR